MRWVDPRHRNLGQFFQDEIASPLGLDFYIRRPESIPASRLATLESASAFARLRRFLIGLALTSFNRRSILHRPLISNPGSALRYDDRHT